MSLRYICLSDLHLGAEHSLLTRLADKADPLPSQPSDTLTALSNAFQALVEQLEVDKNTRLVLLGDVLDLGFSETVDVVNTFKVFAQTFLASGLMDKISKDILFLPGNHDHQLWQNVKNNYMVGQIARGEGSKRVRQVTHLVDPQHLESYLLNDVIQTVNGLEGVTVQIAYPNYAMTNKAGDKAVVMHHGHYTESMYLAMSRLRQLLDDELSMTHDITQIERDNGYWINFLWSSLGSAGFGNETLDIYETLLDAGATHEFIQQLSGKIKTLLVDNFGLSDSAVKSLNKSLTLEGTIEALLDASVGQFAGSERHSFLDVLSDDGVAKLIWYLHGPIRQQFIDEKKTVPHTLNFIYGHTHKPFQDRLPVNGFSAPVNVYNVGGWAIDKPVVSELQGAAIAFVDEHCDVGSLRLFNCSPNGGVSFPIVAGAGGSEDRSCSLLENLDAALKHSQPMWNKFQMAATTDIALHTDRVLRRSFDPNSENGVIKAEAAQ
ncbi:MAG: metallophosphoesterase [Halioglobus sp.]